MRVLDLLTRAVERLSSLLMVVGGVALVLMMAHVFVDVLGKYFLNRPVPMTLETVANYYMVAVVFLPLAAVERNNGHIHVELIYAALPRLARRGLDLLAHALGAFFFGMLTLTAWEVAVEKYEVGEFIMGSYPVIIWPSRFLVPVGGVLITVLLVLKILRSAIYLARSDLDDADGRAQGASH